MIFSRLFVFAWICLYSLAFGYDLDPNNPESVKYVAKRVAEKLMEFYPGDKPGGIPGLFGDPYYWWEAGAVFGALIDYWHFTGDSTYNEVTTQAMLHQVGPLRDYQPPNQTQSLGNDDQAFWALAAMNAAEKKFPDPPPDQPQWLALVQAVFNSQVPRYKQEMSPETCGGGLRWQAVVLNGGYDYKNTISNGCFFQIGARLARYTGDNHYAQWAERVWDWTTQIGFVTPDYSFIDGAWINATSNCTTQAKYRWTYNAGVYLGGAAFMYDYTKKDLWKVRVDRILDSIFQNFFPNEGDIMVETACEAGPTCNVDQRSFKAYLARFMTYARVMAPWTAERIKKKIQGSAIAAASKCNFGADRNTCGLRWTEGEWEGYYGVGEQLSALEVIQSNLVEQAPLLADSKTGTSKGDPAAGRELELDVNANRKPSTKADKGGAGALTGIVLILLILFTWWLVKP